MNTQNQSEVARIRRQIELECEAMQRLASEPAMTASHEIIRHKYDSLGLAHEQLVQLMGEEEAIAIVVDVYSKTIG